MTAMTSQEFQQDNAIPHNWEAEPRLVTDFLENAVLEHAERASLDYMGRTWSYGEVGRLVARAARGLQDLGLAKGDRFALCLPNTPYFVVLYFAALKVGAVVIAINPLYTEHELDHMIRDSGARMIAVPDIAAIHGKVRAVGPAAGIEKIIMCSMSAILPMAMSIGWRVLNRRERVRYFDDGLHVSFFRLLPNRAAADPVAMSTDDLAVLPMFHVFALTAVLNFSVEIAAELVLLPRFGMKQMLASIKRKPPTLFFGVPTLFIAMNALPNAQLPDLSRMRACISGGAPLPLDVRSNFERLMGVRVCEGYGLTEASPIVTCNPIDGLIKENSCGPHFPGTAIEIRDPDNPTSLLPTGERGEVCVRGPQVMTGYWHRPEETANAFVDGALRTGDIGYLDEDGYLFLVDRIKDLILCGGYNVYPRVIEEAAYQHPAVEEAIAIAIPDAYRGQSPKLFVKLRAGQHAEPEEIRTFLAAFLNKIEMPKIVEIRDNLPKTLVGKLSKKELVEEERLKQGQA
jgi:long-chain acyl-CoA synthetase